MKVYTLYSSHNLNKTEAEDYLIETINKYRGNHHTIVAEAGARGSQFNSYEMTEIASKFESDDSIKIIYDEVEKTRMIVLVANGRERECEMKAALMRAICRLVLNDMHAKNFEVNVTVS